MTRLYYPLSEYLKKRFGSRVHRVPVYCGFTCPTRDGAKGTGGCVYCEPAILIPEGYRDGDGVTAQIDAAIERIQKRFKTDRLIAYFQAYTNTYGEADDLRKLYREAASHPNCVALAISTRPDCVPDEMLELLKGLKEEKELWLELGLQSSNDRTLELVNRGHIAEDFKDAVLRAHKRGINVCGHVIFGLPGEAREDMLDTMRFIAGLPVWGVKFHQLEVVRGTGLEDMYKRGGLKLLTLEEYLGLVVESIELLGSDVVIHRLSGDTPARYLVAPRWGVTRPVIKERLEGLLMERKTRQGAKWRGSRNWAVTKNTA
ncbi:MAG: TIGR01212 family radical SAM protein [Deltaproteobacteria bacterium]|nr:TIGR01212 family radical SAM protein [Deltaproteobacteria bacterium]